VDDDGHGLDSSGGDDLGSRCNSTCYQRRSVEFAVMGERDSLMVLPRRRSRQVKIQSGAHIEHHLPALRILTLPVRVDDDVGQGACRNDHRCARFHHLLDDLVEIDPGFDASTWHYDGTVRSDDHGLVGGE